MTIDYQLKQQENHLKLFLSTVDQDFLEAYQSNRHLTMMSPEVLYSVWSNIKYICSANITGDIIEFGTWKGGVLAIAATALRIFDNGKRKLIGIDTFEGYPPPSLDETDVWGNSMHDKFVQNQKNGEKWAYANYDDLMSHLLTIYSNVGLIKGTVSSNFNFDFSREVSFLRLDMNWYEPTLMALKEMYPKITNGGILSIVYGHHSGAKKAADEYLDFGRINFHRINYSTISGQIIR